MAAAQAPTENVGRTRCLVLWCMKVGAEALTIYLEHHLLGRIAGCRPGVLVVSPKIVIAPKGLLCSEAGFVPFGYAQDKLS